MKRLLLVDAKVMLADGRKVLNTAVFYPILTKVLVVSQYPVQERNYPLCTKKMLQDRLENMDASP